MSQASQGELLRVLKKRPLPRNVMPPFPWQVGLRRLRGFLYRSAPAWRGLFRKKLSGFERRWDLEVQGFTKEAFFRVFRERFGLARETGFLVETAAGDGRVGSLGLWLEKSDCGWKVQAWEHRPEVLKQLRQNRPATEVREGRLTRWAIQAPEMVPMAITTRGSREASGLCRAIRQNQIRPRWLGVWNPTQKPVWFQRLRRCRYHLEVVYQRMEFYRLTGP